MHGFRRVLQAMIASRGGRILLAAAFVIVLTLAVAGLLVEIGAVATFGDGWWWAIHHIVDPGALGDDDTWGERAIGLVLTLSGLVILVGVILEVITEAVSRSLERLDNTTMAVGATGHVVFVGWSDRLPEVIRTLDDATRLVGKESWSRDVVVLVAPETGPDGNALRARLRRRHTLLNVQAIVADIDEAGFDLAACRDAQAIVVLRDEGTLEDPVVVDLDAVRRTLLLAGYLDGAEKGSHAPAVFFDIGSAASVDAAAALVPERFVSLVGDRLLSGLLRDSVLEPAWSRAFDKLIDPRASPSVAVIASPDYAGVAFGALSGRLAGAVPVAIAPKGAEQIMSIAPPAGTMLGPDDQLIAVIGGDEPRLMPAPPATPVALAGEVAAANDPLRVLVIGWNGRVPTCLEEFAETRGVRFEVTSLAANPVAERLAAIRPRHAAAISLHCLEGDPLRREDLAKAVEAARPGAIVVTSTPFWGNAAPPAVRRAADADALVTLMHVGAITGGRTPSLILDLFDPAAASAFQGAMPFQTLPTTSIFASTVTWMVIDPGTNLGVSPLFSGPSARRTSVVFRPADGGPHPFAGVHRALIDRGQAAIGIITDDTGDSLLLDPPADHPVRPGDRLLVIERVMGGQEAPA